MDSAVLFDFGGTLDADGIAWKERFHRLFAVRRFYFHFTTVAGGIHREGEGA